MRRVIIESPYAGKSKSLGEYRQEVEANLTYARRAMADCLHRGEAPIASHLLYTQPGVLDDGKPDQRKLGIAAGLAWRHVAELQVFYTDLGWSPGMLAAFAQCLDEKRKFDMRALDGPIQVFDPKSLIKALDSL